ncbi:hypothetical protein CYMTET_37426 [Cymbomonas tetramitiformis]|uniref:Uncharacterized protein n=1 Tax=Cymbomonas tetramitiformis TaxID=36881 RepID=A0AAE0F6N4_9CHLO|nr:hypothetical protein CYMTET_37426 [Cymbomonas tetramitiformis]
MSAVYLQPTAPGTKDNPFEISDDDDPPKLVSSDYTPEDLWEAYKYFTLGYNYTDERDAYREKFAQTKFVQEVYYPELQTPLTMARLMQDHEPDDEVNNSPFGQVTALETDDSDEEYL